ncbi:hypothetical protein KA005_16430 [bacterium]|nr:hypothetical protein [bacterium]
MPNSKLPILFLDFAPRNINIPIALIKDMMEKKVTWFDFCVFNVIRAACYSMELGAHAYMFAGQETIGSWMNVTRKAINNALVRLGDPKGKAKWVENIRLGLRDPNVVVLFASCGQILSNREYQMIKDSARLRIKKWKLEKK